MAVTKLTVPAMACRHDVRTVEMAELAARRSQNPQVIDLAARIGGGQQPEIDTMTGRLQEWGAEVPADDGALGGMMAPEQMQELRGASGPVFDRMFLEMMAEHHPVCVLALRDREDGAVPVPKQVLRGVRRALRPSPRATTGPR